LTLVDLQTLVGLAPLEFLIPSPCDILVYA
jgi:hypothetical protein